MDLFLGSQFYSIDLCPYSVTTLFLLLYCVTSFKIKKYESFNYVLLFQDYFNYQGSLEILCEF